MHALELVLATANPHKVDEIQAILGRRIPDVELLPRPRGVPDVVEDADSLVGNARLKARALMAATGVAAVADDTGLEVDALGGAPGVYSARYAGAEATYGENCAKLLRELVAIGAVAPTARSARFRTVAFVAWPDGTETIAEGVVAGIIAPSELGANGFGYDSVFAPQDGAAGFDRTFAQMSADEKNGISHRSRAFEALATALETRMRETAPRG